MLPLLFAALADTVIAPPPDADVVYVHEWGVVTFEEGRPHVAAAPGEGQEDQQYVQDDEMLVRAPVVYFHGAPFTGRFTVDLTAGDFLETYPAPDGMDEPNALAVVPSAMAAWNLSTLGVEEREVFFREMPIPPGADELCFSHCVDEWRTVPSMPILLSDGSMELFLYYESSLVPVTGEELAPVILTGEGATLEPGYDGESLTFVRGTDGSVTLAGGERDIEQTLCDWAGGSLKSEEIGSMWATWEDWVEGGDWEGDTLRLVPLPQEAVSAISTLGLETNEGYDVEYSRFFVAMVSG